MMTLLIADDEPVIIKGLQALIDWEELGIHICATCENGTDALRELFWQKPDIALLDISMPGKTGIEILKELNAAHSPTRVIFISGFQDFSYARDALNYGAVEYLLKPVKKDALLHAVEKCLSAQRMYPPALTANRDLTDLFGRAASYSPASCILVACEPLGLAQKEPMEQELIRFSIFSQMDMLCNQAGCGFAFQKEKDYYLLLFNLDETQARVQLSSVQDTLIRRNGYRVGFVLSPCVEEINQVPAFISLCRDTCRRYFFFDGWLPQTILSCVSPPFDVTPGDMQLQAAQEAVAQTFLKPGHEPYRHAVDQYLTEAAQAANGHPDAAVYLLLVCQHIVQDRLERAGIPRNGDMQTSLTAMRGALDYRSLSAVFIRWLDQCHDRITDQVQKSSQKDIRSVIEYIGLHYQEKLTLDVLARYIHMNTFYFSSYFKKHVGQNFKDYLNQVRIQHALELLLNTDKRIYEIADMVGFKEYRHFNEVFSRYYGKTPAAYRKEFLVDLSGSTSAADQE